jgi:BASS family bile acid:Na+ symporter
MPDASTPMNAARLVGLAINVSLALMVFSVALSSGTARADAILRRPGLAARSFAAMFVVMPLVAVLIAKYSGLDRALLVTLLLVALSPIPPILPSKQLKTGGDPDYVFGLLAIAALGAILVVPGGVALIGRAFGRELEVPWAVAARVVALSLLAPVVLGLAAARLAPGFARAVGRPAAVAGLVLLVAACVPLFYAAGGAIAGAMRGFTVVALVAFVAIGLAVGHVLGGPEAGHRTTLALATATRHPGVALAVMGAINPDDTSVGPVVLLYLVVSIVATAPYVAWRKRVLARGT